MEVGVRVGGGVRVGLFVTLGHEALLVEHRVHGALVAVDELDLQLVVREVDVRTRDTLALVVLLIRAQGEGRGRGWGWGWGWLILLVRACG